MLTFQQGDIGHDAAEQAHDAGHQGENEDAVIAHNAAEQGEDAGYQAEQEGGDDENGGDNDDNNDNNQVQPPVVAAPAPTPAPNAPAPIAPAVAPPAPILPAVRKLVPKLKWTDAEDDEVLRIVEEIVSQQQRQVTIQDCNGIEVALAAAFQGRWTSVGDGLVRGKNVATAEWLYPPRNARAIERRLKGPGRLLTEYNEILERYGVAKYH